MQVALLLSVSVAAALHPVVATLWLSAEVGLDNSTGTQQGGKSRDMSQLTEGFGNALHVHMSCAITAHLLPLVDNNTPAQPQQRLCIHLPPAAQQ